MTHAYPKKTRNFIAFGTDYVFFASALAFMGLNTILPSFANQLGASPTLVGSIVTVLLISWCIPQLVAGNLAARFERKKSLLVRMVFAGRPFTLLVPLIVILTQARPAWLNLLVILAAMAIFFGTDAFAAVPWYELLGRAFPADERGRIISIWQVGKAVMLFGLAILTGWILSGQGPSFPYNYALLFWGGVVCLGISAIGITGIYESPPPEDEPAATYVAWRSFGTYLLRLWQEDPRFRQLVLARVLFSYSTMAFPFYVLYATDELLMSPQTIGAFIFAQTAGASLSSLILGRVADRWGAQRVIQIGTSVAITAPILALALTLAQDSLTVFLTYIYIWVYVCIGLTENMMMLGYMNYLFDIIPSGKRAMYMGTFNALTSIGVLAPTVAGWLLGQTSYGVLFGVALIFGIITLTLVSRLPLARDLHPPSEEA